MPVSASAEGATDPNSERFVTLVSYPAVGIVNTTMLNPVLIVTTTRHPGLAAIYCVAPLMRVPIVVVVNNNNNTTMLFLFTAAAVFATSAQVRS